MQWAKKQTGFTIVELLIVIVVIAILAAITIVAYNGIQRQAQASVAQSDIGQAVRQLETAKLADPSEHYPTTSAAASLSSSDEVTLTYSPNVSGNAYCVMAEAGGVSYYATNFAMSPREGRCVDTEGLAIWVPMNGSTANNGNVSAIFTPNGVSSGFGQDEQSDHAYTFSPGDNLSSGTSEHFPLMTGSMWVLYSGSGAGTPGIVQGSGGAGPVHWEVTTSGVWRVRLANLDRADVGPGPDPGVWQHVAFTYDRTTGVFHYYINGEETYVTTGDSGLNNYFVGITVGQSNGSSRQWIGRLDDFRLYNRVLSADQIKTLYAAGAQ